MKRLLTLLFIFVTFMPITIIAEEWTDVTQVFLQNPSFIENKRTGWTRTLSSGTLNVKFECMEVYNGVFDVYQILTGLPKGQYRLSVQAFYRAGSNDVAYSNRQKGNEGLTAVVYAGNKSQTIKSVYSHRCSNPTDDVWSKDGSTDIPDWNLWTPNNSIYYPNWMHSASIQFDRDLYVNTIEFEAEGTLQIGIKNDNYIEYNWCVFDNFKLEYKGTIDEADNKWMDATGLIVNPFFNDNKNFGWTRDCFGDGVTSTVRNECMEAYNGISNIHQTLHGLPKGKYRLSVQAFYRECNEQDSYSRRESGIDNVTAVLYAGDREQTIESVYDYYFTSNVLDSCWTSDYIRYYPDRMASARVAFDEGAYKNILEFEADGDIQIGIRNNNYEYGNWVIFDNFKLEYNGTIIPVSDISCNLSKTTLEEGESITATASVLPSNATIKSLIWKSSDPFVFKVNQNGEITAFGRGTATLTIMTNDGRIKKEIIITVVKRQDTDNQKWKNLSFIINNANFDTNGNSTGWNIKNQGSTEVRSGCMEFWDDRYFKVSQVLENLPKGHYRLSVQGFHRYGNSPDDVERFLNNEQTSLAYLYVNEQKKYLSSYCAFSIPSEKEGWVTRDEGKHYLPNTMEAAAEAFSQDAYWNYLEFDVENDKEDVTIGIALDEYTPYNWCIFTNFKLETTNDVDFGHSVNLSVQDENDIDISDKVSILWYDAEGNQIGSGSSLGGVKKDSEIYYSVLLDQSLGMKYREVIKQKIASEEETILCQLQRIEEVTIHGKVSAYGTALPRVEVNVTQWLNGKYEYEVSTLTDANGEFSLDAYNDSTELIVIANGYIDNKIVRENLNASGEYGDIEMEEVKGKIVILNLNYQEATKEGNEPIIQNWFRDTRNIDYSVYNLTKGKEIIDYAIQQGNIVLPTGVENGDRIKITVRSLNEKFAEISDECVITDKDSTEVSLHLLALGGIEANYEQANDESLLVMLYDSTGQFVMRTICSTSRLTLTDLTSGAYTMVTMSYNEAVGSVANISDFAALDLHERIDYVRNDVSVRDGFIVSVNVPSVPELDASKFEYVGENTSYLPNKMQLVVGSFITMTARLDFKEQYEGKVSDIKVIVDIPDGCEFVPNSVVIGTQSVPHVLNGNRLYITVDEKDLDQRIRFCIVPTQTGTYVTTACAEFDYKGSKIQPIGQIQFEATSGELYIPPTTRTPMIAIGGIGVPKADVEVYDDENLIGTTTTLANGKWNLKCELKNPYNLSTHNIYVKYRVINNIEGKTESMNCLYDINAVVVKRVTMLNIAHPAGSLTPTQYESVWDFLNIDYGKDYYSYWPQYPVFTFLIDLSENDTTKVSDVTLYVRTTDGDVRILPSIYNGKLKCFVATGSFDYYSLPVTVSVNYISNTKLSIDKKQYEDKYNSIEEFNIDDDDNHLFIALDDAISQKNDEAIIWLSSQIYSLLGVDRISDGNDETLTVEEMNNITSFLADSVIINNWFNNTKDIKLIDDYGTQYSIQYDSFSSYDITEEELESYSVYELNDNSNIYVYSIDNYCIFVDPQRDVCIRIKFDNNSQAKSKYVRKTRSLDSYISEWTAAAIKIRTTYAALVEAIRGVSSWYELQIAEAQQHLNRIQNQTRRAESVEGSKPIAYYEDKNVERQLLKKLKDLQKVASKLSPFLKIFDVVGMIDDVEKAINSAKEWKSIISDIEKTNCPGMDALAKQAKNDADWVMRGYATTITTNLTTLVAANKLATTGIGVVIAAAVNDFSIIQAGCNELIDLRLQGTIRNSIPGLKNCKKNDDNKRKRRRRLPWHPKNETGIGDPSGYVYEGVPTNRLGGVKATVYFDDNNNPVLWKAEEFGQINPQITDESGLYAWDVPLGMWKVRFEKDGYETQQTDWLPVPPPQLEINIPMQQAIAPVVTKARGAESGIWLTFSKYMKPETLTKSGRVSVTCNGKTVKGEVEMLDLEEDPYNKHEYASKVKFVPDVAFNTTDEVIITVKKEVESYASMQMEADFVQRVTIEAEIKDIVCDSIIVIDYQNEKTVEIAVTPASAAKGKTLHVESTLPMIVSVDRSEVTLNDEGKAYLTVSGNLPGGAALLLSLPEAELTAAPQVQVVMHENVVRKPKASKRTGSIVEEGFLLTLTSTTPGATIYYTTDGSCPCDEQARQRYDGPIVIDKDMTINAIAVREGMDDSEVATFTYKVGDPSDIGITEVGQVSIDYDNGAFVITGAEGGTCNVYDLSGQLMTSKRQLGRQERIVFHKKGVYVVNIETAYGVTYAKKMVVR